MKFKDLKIKTLVSKNWKIILSWAIAVLVIIACIIYYFVFAFKTEQNPQKTNIQKLIELTDDKSKEIENKSTTIEKYERLEILSDKIKEKKMLNQ